MYHDYGDAKSIRRSIGLPGTPSSPHPPEYLAVYGRQEYPTGPLDHVHVRQAGPPGTIVADVFLPGQNPRCFALTGYRKWQEYPEGGRIPEAAIGRWHKFHCSHIERPWTVCSCPSNAVHEQRYGVRVTQYTPTNGKESQMNNNFAVMPADQVLEGQKQGLEQSHLDLRREARELELAHEELMRRIDLVAAEIEKLDKLIAAAGE